MRVIFSGEARQKKKICQKIKPDVCYQTIRKTGGTVGTRWVENKVYMHK